MSGYKPLPSRVLAPELTAAAQEQLSPAERELLDRACEMLAGSLRASRSRNSHGNMVGPVYAREIIAAVGRYLVEHTF